MRGEKRVRQSQGSKAWEFRISIRGREFTFGGYRSEREARSALKRKEGEKRAGRIVAPSEERRRVSELIEAKAQDLERAGKKRPDSYRSHSKPVTDRLGTLAAGAVTSDTLATYQEERLEQGVSGPKINRELSTLLAAMRLAQKQGKLLSIPYVRAFPESPARKGFFTRAEVEKVCANLPDHLSDLVRFLFLTAWRLGEARMLTWECVNREAREITLPTSKSGDPRLIGYPADSELAAVIERRWEARRFRRPGGGEALAAHVFHLRGKPIVDPRRLWKKATEKAEIPGRLIHDLRRSGIKAMVRAGIPTVTAMQISGHKTLATFIRYNVSDAATTAEAISRRIHFEAASDTSDGGEVRRLERESQSKTTGNS
jgi:integrase